MATTKNICQKEIEMGIFDWLFKKKAAAVAPKLNTAVKAKWVTEEREPVGEMSHLDFGKPAGELGCFLNYSKYKVSCRSKEGRKRTLKRFGLDAQGAINKVAAEGFLPPYEATPILEYPLPTDRQLECLKNNGVVIHDGITEDDASTMLSRIIDDDCEEGPSPSLVSLAFGFKIYFSAFVSASGLFRDIVYGADNRDRAALYAYGVRQSMRGEPFGNMLEDPDLSVFYGFADQVLNDEALLRSLKGREPSDYKCPNRGTAIYKAAAAHLTASGV
jgi:hypothetical protein